MNTRATASGEDLVVEPEVHTESEVLLEDTDTQDVPLTKTSQLGAGPSTRSTLEQLAH